MKNIIFISLIFIASCSCSEIISKEEFDFSIRSCKVNGGIENIDAYYNIARCKNGAEFYFGYENEGRDLKNGKIR